ncbi:MAG: tripartite tricarboxylate transporter substrate binding protein [Rhodospirillales bacterium]|nr:tripartite tricarboxylate transporter substrate binding protein [Rhodospirillales bacterium]
MHKLLLTTLSAALFAATAIFSPASAADYPTKPVSFVVPFPPGDLEDVLTRMIAEEFQSKTGVAAAVVNKPGGGGGPFPGAVGVATGPTDGTVIGSFVVDVPVVGPLIGIDELKVDTFEPIGIFLTYPFVIATSKDAPYDTMAQMVTYAKTNKLALGHFGAFMIPTQVTLAAAKTMGFEWGSEAAFDALDCNTLSSGDADVINTTLQLILPCLSDVKVLASVTGERIPLIPDTPTIGELEASLDIALWNGLFVTKGTPQHVKDTIAEIAKSVVTSDKAQAIAAETGAGIYWMGGDEATAQIASDRNVTDKINALIGE